MNNELLVTLLIFVLFTLVYIIYRLDLNIQQIKTELNVIRNDYHNVLLGLGVTSLALGANGEMKINFGKPLTNEEYEKLLKQKYEKQN